MTSLAVDTKSTALPPLARLPVGLITGALGLLLLITSALGGYQFDELYFVAAGEHFAWGYADQPWLVPALAAGLDWLAPGSTLVLRLPVTIAGTLGVLVTALIARELGGRRTGQLLAAATYAVAFGLIALNHQLATSSLDPFWWLLITWLLVRWVRLHQAGTARDGLLLWAGVVTAAALQTKFLAPLLWVGIAAGVLLFGPRSLLGRPKLWLGALLAVLATVPTLIWQFTHDWAYLKFTEVVGVESARLDVLTTIPGLAGLLGTAALIYALWRLARAPELRPYRFLGVALIVVTALVVVLDGRAFYPVGLYGSLFAVAAVELERRNRPRWLAWIGWPAYALSALATAAVVVFSLLTAGAITGRDVAQPIADTYHQLPAQTRAHSVVVADIYPAAAVLQHYAGELGLPPVYSHHRGYYFFGQPQESADTVIYVTSGPDELARMRQFFTSARPAGDGTFAAWVLEGRTQPWSVIWPRMQTGLATN